MNYFISKQSRRKWYDKERPSRKGYESASHMRGRNRHGSDKPNREMMAFLKDVKDAAMADKYHIQQMTETNATMVSLYKQLAGTNAEQQTLIKELTASPAKISRLRVPFTKEKDKKRKEDGDMERTRVEKKKPSTHCGEVGHLPKRCYSLEENTAFRPAWYKKNTAGG